VPNVDAPNFIKQTLLDLKAQVSPMKMIVGEFYTQLSPIHRSLTNNDIEAVKKSFPTKQSPGSEKFTARLYNNFKEELARILLTVFH
jgi:hypothetical protein